MLLCRVELAEWRRADLGGCVGIPDGVINRLADELLRRRRGSGTWLGGRSA